MALKKAFNEGSVLIFWKHQTIAYRHALGIFFQSLTSESVEGTSLPLEGIDDIHSGDSLPLGVFGVGDGITDDVLKEDLEDTTGLLVDQARDTLDTSTSRQTADGGLGDALDVITQYFAMTLGASFAESFSSFSSSSHVDSSVDKFQMMTVREPPSLYILAKPACSRYS